MLLLPGSRKVAQMSSQVYARVVRGLTNSHSLVSCGSPTATATNPKQSYSKAIGTLHTYGESASGANGAPAAGPTSTNGSSSDDSAGGIGNGQNTQRGSALQAKAIHPLVLLLISSLAGIGAVMLL